ncbi:MAG: M48 family metallopeptidase, partial [Bdellovibrionota bacterium]
PAQLGTVLGHEVGHVLAGHSKERVSEEMVTQGGISLLGGILASKENPKRNIIMGALGLGAQFGVTLPHSRTQESEADLIGLDLMAQAGFDPRESLVLWKNMEEMGGSQPPVFLSDHPSHGSRIDNLQSHMEKALVTFQKAGSHPNCHQ